MRVTDQKWGWAKQLLMVLVLILACEETIKAEPFSLTTFLVSMAVSAALAVAQIGLQLAFQPKPKPQDKNKFQGDIQLTTVGEDVPMVRIYGGSPNDNKGGIKVGGNIFFLNQIRKVVIVKPGGSSGGKGAPKQPSVNEHHYYCDIGIMIGGNGPLRIKAIYANTDLLYQDFTPANQLAGTEYEAEDRTDGAAGVTEVGDADMSGNIKANLDQTEWVEWNNVVATSDTAPVEMHIVYKSSVDIEIELTVNGVVTTHVLAESFGLRRSVNLPQTLAVGSSNVIRIENLTNAVLSLDQIVVGTGTIEPPGDDPVDPCYLSGVEWDGWINPEPTYDYMGLRPVYDPDPRGCQQYNYQANADAQGIVTAPLANGALRVYPGNYEQLPDPIIQARYESTLGPGSTPAFRGRPYIFLENFEITKYGTIPNFFIVCEHANIHSLGEMYADLALQSGLDPTEFDFTALEAVPLRGYAIENKEPANRSMEILNRVFEVDVTEDDLGIITGVIPSEIPAAIIPKSELDAMEDPDPETNKDRPFQPVEVNVVQDTELPTFFDVSFYDPTWNWEVRNVHSLRQTESSQKKDNMETRVVMLESEAQKFADRELQRMYVEKDGIKATIFHKHTYINPTDKVQFEDVDDSAVMMRVKSRKGWMPGALELAGVSRDAIEYFPRVFTVPNENPTLPSYAPPAPLVGTFIDLAVMRDENEPGFYVCAALTDPHYTWTGAGVFRQVAEGEYQPLVGLQYEATMGLTADALPDVPGSWDPEEFDDTNDVTVDLYEGEGESFTDEQIAQGLGVWIIGNEIIQAGVATRDNGFPNRWVLSHLQRRLFTTDSTGHVSGERAVYFTDAVQWLPQDPQYGETEFTYKFVSTRGNVEKASSVDFAWTGRSRYNSPIYTSVDNGVPILDSAGPDVYVEGANWHIFIKRPVQNGFSAHRAQIRVLKSADDSLLRELDIGDTIDGIVVAPVDDSEVQYRWQNGYRLFGSDGWSAWSTATVILAASPPPTTPPTGGGDGGTPPGPGDPDFDPVGCFVDWTQVLMADWTWKYIQDVRKGDYVMSWRKDGKIMPGQVKSDPYRFLTNEFERVELTNDELQVTGHHPFGCEDLSCKVRVQDMVSGNRLAEYIKGWGGTEVVSRETVAEEVYATNIEIAVLAKYFVRGREDAGWKAVYNKAANQTY